MYDANLLCVRIIFAVGEEEFKAESYIETVLKGKDNCMMLMWKQHVDIY